MPDHSKDSYPLSRAVVERWQRADATSKAIIERINAARAEMFAAEKEQRAHTPEWIAARQALDAELMVTDVSDASPHYWITRGELRAMLVDLSKKL